jgi:putative transcriptional regulator
VRIFRGYAGWGPGQLEGEIESGAWLVLDAEPDDVFAAEPDELWRSVLRRQGGRLAWLASAPDDLSAN